jgi:hypothetical protein
MTNACISTLELLTLSPRLMRILAVENLAVADQTKILLTLLWNQKTTQDKILSIQSSLA